MVACFVNTVELPLKTRHISYYTSHDGIDVDVIILHEIVENTYRHPEAPEQAVVICIEDHILGRYHRRDPESAAVILLEASLANCNKAILKSSNKGV